MQCQILKLVNLVWTVKLLDCEIAYRVIVIEVHRFLINLMLYLGVTDTRGFHSFSDRLVLHVVQNLSVFSRIDDYRLVSLSVFINDIILELCISPFLKFVIQLLLLCNYRLSPRCEHLIPYLDEIVLTFAICHDFAESLRVLKGVILIKQT